MTLDDIEAAIYDEQLRGMAHMLDAANAERERASDVIERLSAENEQLLSLLAAKGIDAGTALDAAGLSAGAGQRHHRAHDPRHGFAFHSAGALPRFIEPKPDEPVADPL